MSKFSWDRFPSHSYDINGSVLSPRSIWAHQTRKAAYGIVSFYRNRDSENTIIFRLDHRHHRLSVRSFAAHIWCLCFVCFRLKSNSSTFWGPIKVCAFLSIIVRERQDNVNDWKIYYSIDHIQWRWANNHRCRHAVITRINLSFFTFLSFDRSCEYVNLIWRFSMCEKDKTTHCST